MACQVWAVHWLCACWAVSQGSLWCGLDTTPRMFTWLDVYIAGLGSRQPAAVCYRCLLHVSLKLYWRSFRSQPVAGLADVVHAEPSIAAGVQHVSAGGVP
jgi:hypothetical protein